LQTTNFDFLKSNDSDKLEADRRENSKEQETSLTFEKPTAETSRRKSALILVKTANL
jgi:hypothetical protein